MSLDINVVKKEKNKNKNKNSNSAQENIKIEESTPIDKVSITSTNRKNKENNTFNISELLYHNLNTDNHRNYIRSSKIEDDNEIAFLLGELKENNMHKQNNLNLIKSQTNKNPYFNEITSNFINNKQLFETDENSDDNEIRQRQHKKKPEKYQILSNKKMFDGKIKRHENIFQKNEEVNKNNFNLSFKDFRKTTTSKNKKELLKTKGLLNNGKNIKSKESKLNNRNRNLEILGQSNKLKKNINIRLNYNSLTNFTYFPKKLSILNNDSLNSKLDTSKNLINNQNVIKNNNINNKNEKNYNLLIKTKIGENYIRFTNYNNEINNNITMNAVSRNRNKKLKKPKKIITLENRLFDDYTKRDRYNTDNCYGNLSYLTRKICYSQSPKIKLRDKSIDKLKNLKELSLFDRTKRKRNINSYKKEDIKQKNIRQKIIKNTNILNKKGKLKIIRIDYLKKIPTIKINL